MFIDYYNILDVSINSSMSEIKAAYKKQAIKWHPDKNPGLDTTLRMQQINEAYLILIDNEARERFNNEYKKYTAFQSKVTSVKKTEEYTVEDDVLSKWMANAKKQSVSLAKQTLDDLLGMSKQSGSAMLDAALGGVGKLIGLSLIMFIIMKACR